MPSKPLVISWPIRAWPRIRISGRYPLADTNFEVGYRIPAHALHLYDYAATIRIGDDAEFQIQPGDITFTPANTTSRYHVPTPGHHLTANFFPASEDGPCFDLPLHISPGPERRFVRERMMRVIQLHRQAREHHSPLAEAEAAAALQEVLLWLGRFGEEGHRPSTSRSMQAVERVAEIISQRSAEPLAVPDLAREVGVTQNHLAKRFRQRFGMTIPRYVQQCRVENAAELLATTNLPVGVIGVRVGLSDPQHFNKLFRRHLGQSPTQYRPTHTTH